MHCPQCNHPISESCTKCLYCGASIGEAEVGPERGQDAPAIRMQQPEPSESADAPDNSLSGFENSVETERPVAKKPEHATPETLSLEKIVAVLAKMKNLVDSKKFEPDVYERMALEIVRDYLSTMDNSVKLIFVSYEIRESALAPYVTEEMIEKLKISVMDMISRA